MGVRFSGIRFGGDDCPHCDEGWVPGPDAHTSQGEACDMCGGTGHVAPKPPVVVRITRHPLDSDREKSLKAVYGDDVRVITEDVPYGDDPVKAVRSLIERTETDGQKVVAVEAQAPFPALMRLVDSRRDLGVALIRAQFERDGGREPISGY